VGETTAGALALAGHRVDFVPELDNSGRGLVKEWPDRTPGLRVLTPQSNLADTTLPEGLGALGIDVVCVSAYTTIGMPVADNVRADVASGRISAVLISSGSVARQVAEQLAPLPETTIVACIGPRTAFDARAAGLTVHVIAEDRSSVSLVETLVEYVSR
jgi:uroporphyrinogen-III synthase